MTGDDPLLIELSGLAKKKTVQQVDITACPELGHRLNQALDVDPGDRRALYAALDVVLSEAIGWSDHAKAGGVLVGHPRSERQREQRLADAGKHVGVSSARAARRHEGQMLQELAQGMHAVLTDTAVLTRLRTRLGLQRPTAAAAPPAHAAVADESGPKLSRLVRLSRQVIDDLDAASSGAGILLSGGLYVVRTLQSAVIKAVRENAAAVAVVGEAGQGKSSLLWGVHRELASTADVLPLLVDAQWLLSRDQELISPDDLVAAVTELAPDPSRRAVLLIDTVDLLLHADIDRVRLLDLCRQLVDIGAAVVVTCRPEEATGLPRPQFRLMGLMPYDNDELPRAVQTLTTAFCPAAPPAGPDAKLDLILGAVARGLPVREVCRNPLHLRLLFEVYAPEFPSLEVDVDALYARYWVRRVAADRRREHDAGLQRSSGDFSTELEHIAIAQLAAGRTELSEDALRRSVRQLSRSDPDSDGSPDRLGLALAVLAQRGVIVGSERGIRLFHQTMFEYAAARGLLGRDGSAAIAFLVAHLEQHPNDLFVGAVLEQLLNLAAADPLYTPAVQKVVDSAADSGGSAMQRIALAVLARTPRGGKSTLEDAARRLIRRAEPGTLNRFASITAAVATDDSGHIVDLLVHVWQRDRRCEPAVLAAWERLAERAPGHVRAAVDEVSAPAMVMQRPLDAGELVRLLARVVVAVGKAHPRWANERLRDLLAAVLDRTTSRVLPIHLIDLIAAHWSALADTRFGDEILGLVVAAQEHRETDTERMRRAAAALQARIWQDTVVHDAARSTWPALVADGVIRIQNDNKDPSATLRLAAIAELLHRQNEDAPLWNATLPILLAATDAAPLVVGTIAFPILLHARPARVQPIVALLNALPAPANRPPAGPATWAAAARIGLQRALLPPAQLAALLAGSAAATDEQLWLADDGLAVLLVASARGGHKAAMAALCELADGTDRTSDRALVLICYSIAERIVEEPELVGLLVDLSVRRKAELPLAAVVREHGHTVAPHLAAATVSVTRLLDLLFLRPDQDDRRKTVALWLDLVRCRALSPPGRREWEARFTNPGPPAARGNMLALLVHAAIEGTVDVSWASRVLAEHFGVDGSGNLALGRATRTPRRATGKRSAEREVGPVTQAARRGWIEVQCVTAPPAQIDETALLEAATALPTDSEVLGLLGLLVQRLATDGQAGRTANLLVNIARAAVRAGLSPKAESRLANRMRGAMRATFRSATAEERHQLLAQVPELPVTSARILVASAAQECFSAVRRDLERLLQGTLPGGVRQQIHDDMHARRRTGADGVLPALLAPLAPPTPSAGT